MAEIEISFLSSELEVTLLNDATVIEGPPGTWSAGEAFVLRKMSVPIVAGQVEIDMSDANTFFILLTENITSISFTNLPVPDKSIRVQVYLQQDLVGGRTVTGWPAGTYPADNIAPEIGAGPRERTGLTLDTFDGGASVQLNLVGTYGPIA